MMHSYRNNTPRELGGNKVVKIYDYQIGVERDLINNSEIPLVLPKANVLIFVTSEGSRIALRPSGTEPKIKFYLSVANTYQKEKSWEYNLEKIEKQLKILENDLPL